MRMSCYQELLEQPGVYAFVFDNCRRGETYRHRQVIVTTMPCPAALAKDCEGGHQHDRIGFDKPIQTREVPAYSMGFVKA